MNGKKYVILRGLTIEIQKHSHKRHLHSAFKYVIHNAIEDNN